jgi:hypothetical protein
MVKKIILGFFITSLIMIGVFGLAGCDDEINAIEKAKVQARQTYLNTIVKPEYPNATIADVYFTPFLGVYNDSLVAIFYGGQYHGSQIAVEETEEIDNLNFAFSYRYPILVWNDGKISSLTAAYEQGLLTKENLTTIHNLYYDIDDGVEVEMEIQSRQTYLNTIVKPRYPDATIADVSFSPFLGVYSDSLVAVFYGGQYHGPHIDLEVTEEIENIIFVYPSGYPILVWNDGKISSLTAAYEQGLLTKENLTTIQYLYRVKK